MQEFLGLPARARWFIAAVGLTGAAMTAGVLLRHPVPPEVGAFLFIVITACAGLVKVPLPVVGSLSLGYALILATLLTFGPGTSTVAALLSALASETVSWSKGRRPPVHRAVFNAGVATVTASVAARVYVGLGGGVGTLRLSLAGLAPILPYTFVFVLLNLGLISAVIGLVGESDGKASLRANLAWSIPGYLAGSSLAILLNLLFANGNIGMLGLAAPFAYLVHLAYRARTEQTAELYFGIIKALALAVEAKDENTEEHLRRVEQYSVGIAGLLGMAPEQIEALRAAALLHDVGKLAVPEYILTKPGKLTEDEVETMKVHPVVGAEILDAVPFPFPLAPIVRHHHERWDGSGYPDGLAAKSIPLGARILSTVDCFDAIISDRPYRKAVTRTEAFAYLRAEAGSRFDPEIVELLVRHADELEAGVEQSRPAPSPEVKRRERPGRTPREPERRAPVPADARRLEAETLANVARVTALGLSTQDRLELVSAKLQSWIPHRSLVLYLPSSDGEELIAVHAVGWAAGKIRGHSIGLGFLLTVFTVERMVGWAALQRRPYAGRTHRDALQRDGSRFDLEELASDPEVAVLDGAVVAPIGGDRALQGVLALYRDGSCGDLEDDLRSRILAVAAVLDGFTDDRQGNRRRSRPA